MKSIKIHQTNNGFLVDQDGQEYVYSNIEDKKMFEVLYKYLFGKPVKVVDR